ncbi:MAG: elongation factor G [Acidimicrobiia bacterium]|nr:MAG: elongation factor G [Acidimicrobiia bacterium]
MGSDQIRNVALVGHGGSGKTMLAEALLFAAGVTTRMGRVEDGNTVTDFEPEEHERGSSVSLAMAPFTWKGHRINLIDTPGTSDFVGEVRAALRIADLALFVVSAVDGVQVQTEQIWRMAAEEGIARAVFVSKLDRERASFSTTLAELKQRFGTPIAPIQVPLGAESGLRGVANLVGGRAYTYSGGFQATEGDIPAEAASDAAPLHTSLVEAVVETDDALLEKYFEGVEPSGEQLIAGMHKGMVDGTAFPVLCGSAVSGVGIDRLAQFLVDYGPRPSERPVPPLAEGTWPDRGVVAYVFKTMSDPYVGRISLFRMFAGDLDLDMELENPARHATGRMHNVFQMRGKEHHEVKRIEEGDIAAVAKLEATLSGDTLRSPGLDVVIAPVPLPPPTMALAVFPRSQQDEEKLSTALTRAVDDDPTLRVERHAATNETVLAGLGDAHLEVTASRLSRRFGVEIDTALPRIPYRETIRGTADVEGKHKKQSGGRGQFGVANIRFEPAPSGNGFEFVNEIKGGSIPRQYLPAVEKGVIEALQRGLVAGYPVVDVRATVYDGKYHPVDSDELSFRMAGIIAVKEAAPKLAATLLEPIMRVTVRVPEELMGDVIGDLNSKRGKVLGMDSEAGTRVLTAEVPLAEMQRYAIDLRSITSGRGTFEMEMSHYEEAPPHEAQRVIAAANSDDQAKG